jgi:DNA-binding transcriptional LysR family regulator
MNPTLRQMRAFVALGKSGSFTLAAGMMHVTQAALSGLIKELETTLGAKVVDRSTRRITLTDTGRELLPVFGKILDDLDGALHELSDRTRLKKGLVRIAAPQLMCCTLLPPLIAAYKQRHPDIRIQLSDSAVDDVTGRLLSGEADLGIGPERETPAGIGATLLFELPFAVALPHDHALASRKRIAWADLAPYPFISLHGQFTERLLSDMHAAVRDFTLRPAHEVGFMTTALAMVAAGLGIAVCLPYAAPLANMHGLVLRPLSAPRLTRKFYVYQQHKRTLSSAADSFLAFLREHAATT